MANDSINWMDKDEYAALVIFVREGKITPIIDIIGERMEQGRAVHSAILGALRSLDHWDNGVDYFIKELPDSSKEKKRAGRPNKSEADPLYQFKRNALALTISKICYECIEAGEKKLPTKAELTRRILQNEDMAYISGFVKLKSTRRNELIDEIYMEFYKEPYPAGKPLN